MPTVFPLLLEESSVFEDESSAGLASVLDSVFELVLAPVSLSDVDVDDPHEASEPTITSVESTARNFFMIKSSFKKCIVKKLLPYVKLNL